MAPINAPHFFHYTSVTHSVEYATTIGERAVSVFDITVRYIIPSLETSRYLLLIYRTSLVGGHRSLKAFISLVTNAVSVFSASSSNQ